MILKNVTFGSDPEFGIVDKEGYPVQIIDFIPGSKKIPFDIGNGCGIQPDNVMVETTQPPTNNRQQFIDYIKYCRETAQHIIRKETGEQLNVVSISSAKYTKKQLSHPIAQKFGCEPSYCIYTRAISPRPTPDEIGELRSAGFHLHIGFDGLADINDIEFIIYLCDIYLGLTSILVDKDTDRRRLYGNAGDFRNKEILTEEKEITVVEYRVLGGAMHESDELVGWCFDQLQKVVNIFNKYQNITRFNSEYKINPKEIQTAIDTGDAEQCLNLLNKIDIATYSSVRNITSRKLQLQ